MFIQEALFACFTLAFVIAARPRRDGRGPRVVDTGGRRGRPGGCHQGDIGDRAARRGRGLRGCLVVARIGAAARTRWPTAAGARPPSRASPSRLVVAAMFYSSFFTAPAAILEPFRGAGTYLARGDRSRQLTPTRGTTTFACSPTRRPAA